MKTLAVLAVTFGVLLAGAPAHAFKLNLNKLGDLVERVTGAGDALGTVTEAQERRLGADLAARLLGAAPLVADAEVQRYVNRVGLWVALQSERPELPWRFGVLDTDTVNAFAVPGGYVFVTRGLFSVLENEAELAGVLAHEISHVTRRHHLAAIQKKARTELAAELVATLVSDNARISSALVAVGMSVYGKGLDRGDELDADRHGLATAARAGYDPYGLPVVLHTLANLDPDDEALAFMLSTHPSFERRLEALAPLLDEHFDDLPNARTGDERFASIGARLQ